MICSKLYHDIFKVGWNLSVTWMSNRLYLGTDKHTDKFSVEVVYVISVLECYISLCLYTRIICRMQYQDWFFYMPAWSLPAWSLTVGRFGSIPWLPHQAEWILISPNAIVQLHTADSMTIQMIHPWISITKLQYHMGSIQNELSLDR